MMRRNVEIMENNKYAINAELNTMHNIKLNIQNGSVTCIAGDKNSGKTRIIKMLADVIKLEEGFIDFNGLSWLNNDVEIKRKVSFVYDYINFNLQVKPERIVKDIMACEENFDYNYFTEKMDRLNLDKKVRILKYSYSMRVMLKVLIAISRRPEILILDEPFDNIDFEYRYILLNLLKEFMQEEKHTIIFTHNTGIENKDDEDDEEIDLIQYNDFNCKLKEFCDEIVMIDTDEVIINEKGFYNKSVNNSYEASNNLSYKNYNKSIKENIYNKCDNNYKVYKSNFIKKWFHISNLYISDGTSSTQIGFIKWPILFVVISTLLDMMFVNVKANNALSLLGYSIVFGVMSLNKTFRDRTSLIYNLAISRGKHIFNSYILIGIFSTIMLFIACIIKFSYSHEIISDFNSKTTYIRIEFYMLIFAIVFFLYFPLTFIYRARIWMSYVVGVSVILFAINSLMIKSVSFENSYRMKTSIIEKIITQANYPWYIAGLGILCIIICIASYKASYYFLSVERYHS